MKAVSVNYLCIHQNHRSKRFVPALVKEMTRRCASRGVTQAAYTSGEIFPKPIGTTRYYHRSLNFRKLYEADFTSLSPNQSIEEAEERQSLPDETKLPNLRPLQQGDIARVCDLLNSYLGRFSMAPVFTKEGVERSFFHETDSDVPVVSAYVVEDLETQEITDFISYTTVQTTIIQPMQHDTITTAYLNYYATSAFSKDRDQFHERLKKLVLDALILAKAVSTSSFECGCRLTEKAGCDVFNCLSLGDNPVFTKELRFMRGTGTLHYYLFNYRTGYIPSESSQDHSSSRPGGIGLVLL